MAAGRVKMLFSDAPPGALEDLLSPKRKLFYGLFAFGPGTLLGLYLYSVKRRMERENEEIRLEQVENELSAMHERESKDMVLAAAIQEMRDRLRRLEEEAITSREKTAKMAAAAEEKTRKGKIETPFKVGSAPSESKIEAALALLKSKEQPEEMKQEASASWLSSSLDGTKGRRDKRHQEMLQQDVAAYIAKQKEQTK
ncbi:hypothetical protein DVH05_008975 [Phytophthora capsici]|nr:hypothetical protein DVH05_008975 [Phytophthora capsici]